MCVCVCVIEVENNLKTAVFRALFDVIGIFLCTTEEARVQGGQGEKSADILVYTQHMQ